MKRLVGAFEIAFQVAFMIGGSIALGLVIDHWLSTLPLFVIIMNLLGIAGSFWRIVQLSKL